MKEDTASVVSNPTALDFTEPDATVVTDSPTGTAKVALSSYALLAGRTGGQIVRGGSNWGDGLELRANAVGSPTGTIHLAANGGSAMTGKTGDYLTGVTIWRDGLRVGTASTQYGVLLSSTITQAAAATYGLYAFTDRHIRQGATGGQAYGSDVSFFAVPTIDNNVSGAAQSQGSTELTAGLYAAPSCSVSAGTGSLTLAKVAGVQGTMSIVSTGCTVTDAFLGGEVSSPFSVTGTITRAWGWHVGALTSGVSRFPFGATEHTITGTVPSNEGVWGTESHAPTRFYFRNDSADCTGGCIWRQGSASIFTGTASNGLGTAANYCVRPGTVDGSPPNSQVAAGTGPPLAAAYTVFAMSCGLTTAPNTGNTRTVALGACSTQTCTSFTPSAVTCAFAAADTTCKYISNAGVSFTAASWLSLRIADTGSPDSADLGCTIYYTIDAF